MAELLALDADPSTVSLLVAHVSPDIEWTEDLSDLQVMEQANGTRRPALNTLSEHLGGLVKTYPNLFKAKSKSGTGKRPPQEKPKPAPAQKPRTAAEKVAEMNRKRGY
jgi:hypothetical protein